MVRSSDRSLFFELPEAVRDTEIQYQMVTWCKLKVIGHKNSKS